VSEVGNAVVGRGVGIVDVDTASPRGPGQPAYSLFGVGSTARVVLADTGPGDPVRRAVRVAEVVADHRLVPTRWSALWWWALVRAGVTSTTAVDTGSRYGLLDVDSNLPDAASSLGGAGAERVTAAVLAAAGPG